MKKSAFLSLVCTLFVLTTLTSCSMTPDMMLEQYNGKLYEDIGGGIYITDGKPNVSTTLIKLPAYSVMEGGLEKIIIDKDYLEYKWTLTNTTTNKSIVIGDCYFLYLEAPKLNFKEGEKYSLSVLVKNRNGIYFTDTATINVVKNIYIKKA